MRGRLAGPLNAINSVIARYTDLLLAFGVIAVVGTMVIRIPPGAMDYLIAGNVCISIVVLLTALYIRDASRLPSFPTILLLATLFRLALNVSTTRLILLEADAGEIIFAFGDFVVRGNYVVGAVVFLVLVLVQFIVIAKGSERVAEVSARFTLDAMQGKQMSIDADFRNGLISPEESRERRAALDRESKLYGAMDGAMKFVKGDAIAGIIISAINIVGGLIVGVAQQNMPVGEAAQVYSLLTIGDGLVSQIPALLLSVAAGLVVTRVAAADDEESNLASDLLGQFLAQPRALLIAAVMLAVFAATSGYTGFPPIPFGILSVILATVAISSLLRGRRTSVTAKPDAEQVDADEHEPLLAARPPLSLAIERSLETMLLGPNGDAAPEIKAALRDARQRATRAFGVSVPAIAIQRGEARLRQGGYAIRIHDTPVATGQIPLTGAIAFVNPDIAKNLGITGEPAAIPWSGQPALAIGAHQIGEVREKGIQVYQGAELVLEHLNIALQRHAHEFVTVQTTSERLDEMKEKAPDLVKAVTPMHLTTTDIADLIRALLREQIPVRDLTPLLESLARRAPVLKGQPVALLAAVRTDLARVICDRFSRELRILRFVSVDPRVESRLLNAAALSPDGEVTLNIDPDVRRELLQSAAMALAEGTTAGAMKVMVTSPECRQPARALLMDSIPDAAVMSYAEIAPEFTAIPVARFEMSEAGADATGL